jgi:signal transduction histidine kinase
VDPSFDHYLTLNRLATVARLVSGATHEVNNALQVIGGTVELLAALSDLPESARKGLERVGTQSARAAAAMTGMTELVRPPTGEPARLDLREVVGRAAGLRRYAVGRAGLTLALDVGEAPLVVLGRAPHLLQALVNVIDNAEQALRPAGSGHIEIVAGLDHAVVQVTVSDDGPGVAPEIAARAFEPFVTTKPRVDSLGLGLFVARGIAEAHGGTLDSVVRPKGAAFVLRLPRAPE